MVTTICGYLFLSARLSLAALRLLARCKRQRARFAPSLPAASRAQPRGASKGGAGCAWSVEVLVGFQPPAQGVPRPPVPAIYSVELSPQRFDLVPQFLLVFLELSPLLAPLVGRLALGLVQTLLEFPGLLEVPLAQVVDAVAAVLRAG